ncbi:retron St85 family effector protein [Roseivirga pacifica]|uniref:retron St85 family effector protein n=1 Tax=Roseivirga pacifica TaxID=1267423 RepID=UPI002094CBAB|nr:retron St85 family effector protein [Roseivirga pacifica]MCO6358225.1 hypothetical protein [Roseivirga pacifica]MCO6366311.1 hypothetical protein [Roseivirga pacifica]MCO6369138.1 hypothetical protein [Roseivirga pacifica]MCO6373956.1 hypothetical protein [Roseivirga pacifica]MCO6378332.1 hypothetical protein [Roseivirga pacifica]
MLKQVVKTGKILFDKDNQIVFLFGAKPDPDNKGCRQEFHEYSEKHLSHYKMLLSEDFFNVFDNGERLDLLTIESQLAAYTDCVLIFLESAGSLAELGAFSLHDELAKITLVVNNSIHQQVDSFINLGPLKRVEKKSKFGGAIYGDFSNILLSVNEIEKRLKGGMKKRSYAVNISSFENLEDRANRRFKMLFISDLINLLGPIRKKELIYVLKYVFDADYINIDFELSLLESLKLTKSDKEFIVRGDSDEFYFFKYKGLQLVKLRSGVVNHFAKYYPDRFNRLLK